MEEFKKTSGEHISLEAFTYRDKIYIEEASHGTKDLMSGSYLGENCTIDRSIIEFGYSFGYDSARRSNLCVADDHTILYLSGNYIHVYDVDNEKMNFIRSLGGVGLGHIAKHPLENIIAVGERGDKPLLVLYNYPEFTINRVLKGGTEKNYNYLSFSPDGKWLITLGGEPDNSLTVWDWDSKSLVLLEKVGRESWIADTNPFVPGEIIVSGANHIMFWMRSETFTGLKLKGYPGKFGSYPFCDINTFCAVPKGKVLSPNQSNNLYVWRGEEINIEIRRSGSLPLHDDNIRHIEYKETCNEILSVGQEGTYKVWDYTRIMNAPKNVNTVELQPTYQRRFHDKLGIANPTFFQKKYKNDTQSADYYMQDKCGSIWLVEMAVKPNLMPSKRIFIAHESPIGDIAPSPTGFYLATIGAEGKLHIYCIDTKKILAVKKFGVGGSSILWLPQSVDSTGSILIVGFTDGSVRIIILAINASILENNGYDDECLNIIQAFKPHNQAVSIITLNPHRTENPMVITCSLDKKVFIYWLKPIDKFLKLEPYAFVEMPGGICYATWNPISEAILVVTQNGVIAEICIPDNLPKPPSNTYRISLLNRLSYFRSVKSQLIRKNVILRNLLRKQKRKARRAEFEEKQEYERMKRKEMMTGKKVKEVRVTHRQKGEKRDECKKVLKDFRKKWKEECALAKIKDGGKMTSMEMEQEYEKEQKKSISLLSDIPLSVFLKKMSKEYKEEYQELFSSESNDSSSISNQTSTESSEEMEYDRSEDDVSSDEAVPQLYIPSEPPPLYFAKYIDNDSFWVSAGSYDSGYIYTYNLGENSPKACTPFPMDGIEIISYSELSHGDYFIFGLNNGGIMVVKRNPADILDFSDNYLIIMHDNLKGKVRKICVSHDEQYLFSLGEDANIFLYKLNLSVKKPTKKSNLMELAPLASSLIVKDIISAKTLSLEDELIIAEQGKIIKMGEEKKAYLIDQLHKISLRFQLLRELNESLPESQRLKESYFEIDPRYAEGNRKSIYDRKTMMIQEIETECWQEIKNRDRVYNYFVNPIQTFKIYLFGIEYENRVTSFYQRKLTNAFLQAEKEAEAYIIEILKRGSHKQLHPLKISKGEVPHKLFRRSRLEVKPLFKGDTEILKQLDSQEKAIFTRLSERRERRKLLNNVLALFLEEKAWKKKQFAKDIESRKEEKVDMRHILKSDPSYKLSNLRKITTEKKFYQLITTKRKIYNLMTQFNVMVLKLREKKSKILALYNACKADESLLLKEFPGIIFSKTPQQINLIEPLEFPELYLMDYPPNFPHKEDLTFKYNINMNSQLNEINKSTSFSSEEFIEEQRYKLLRLKDVLSEETIANFGFNKLWEHELLEERKQFLLSEYYKKGKLIESMVLEYDEELEKLISLRVDFEVKIIYLRIFYQKYYEELQIVRSHQMLETQIENKVEVYIIQKHIYILRINVVNKKIQDCLNEINMSTRRIERISKAFIVLIAKLSSKFKRHLTSLFKKKWKPEKIKHDDDESSSSEEEEEEEEEEDEEDEEEDQTGELFIEDLLEMDHKPVDERTKPDGLDDYTFDETFNLRDLRQNEEKRIFDTRGKIQELNDRKDELRQTLLTIETIIAFYKVKLSYVLENKHKELSCVRTIVILDASQMQHFDIESKQFPPVRDTILFPLYNLKNLETRKRQLKDDILNVLLKKQDTVKHVKRLDLDINYLRKNLKNLSSQIKKETLEKFGAPVNIEKLEEHILLKIAKDLKYNTLPFHMRFHVDLVKLKEELERIDLSSTEHVKKNTYEELKYGALLEQKRIYEKCLERLKLKKPTEYINMEELNKNIHELLAVLKMQDDRIECLENEISRLKYISYTPDITKKKKSVQLKEIKDLLEETDQTEEIFEEEELVDSFEENLQSEFEILSKMTEYNMTEAKLIDETESGDENFEYEQTILENLSDYLAMEREDVLLYEEFKKEGIMEIEELETMGETRSSVFILEEESENVLETEPEGHEEEYVEGQHEKVIEEEATEEAIHEEIMEKKNEEVLSEGILEEQKEEDKSHAEEGIQEEENKEIALEVGKQEEVQGDLETQNIDVHNEEEDEVIPEEENRENEGE